MIKCLFSVYVNNLKNHQVELSGLILIIVKIHDYDLKVYFWGCLGGSVIKCLPLAQD